MSELATVLGQGGIGKTRLAFEVARRVGVDLAMAWRALTWPTPMFMAVPYLRSLTGSASSPSRTAHCLRRFLTGLWTGTSS